MPEQTATPLSAPNHLARVACALLGCLAIFSSTARADLEPLGAEQLSAASVPGAGISILLANTNIRMTVGEVALTDPATGATLTLREVVVGDGAEGGVSLDTFPGEPNTIDVVTDPLTGVSALALSMNRQYPYTLTVEHLVLDGHDLGELALRDLWWRRTELLLAGHADGSAGLSAALASEGALGEFSLAYNTSGESLRLSGVHWAGTASGAPHTPSEWSFSGPLQIGSLPDHPLTMDVIGNAVDAIGNPLDPHVLLNLPLSGTLRIENLALGNQQFGPVALDGLRVHSLSLQLAAPAP